MAANGLASADFLPVMNVINVMIGAAISGLVLIQVR
jgi:hypothetical protein